MHKLRTSEYLVDVVLDDALSRHLATHDENSCFMSVSKREILVGFLRCGCDLVGWTEGVLATTRLTDLTSATDTYFGDVE